MSAMAVLLDGMFNKKRVSLPKPVLVSAPVN